VAFGLRMQLAGASALRKALEFLGRLLIVRQLDALNHFRFRKNAEALAA
jgi:hypothetical protein